MCEKVFYMVFRNSDSGCARMPTVKYATEQKAMEEANRLCLKERDKFYVLKAISYCELTSITWGTLQNE